MHFCISLDVATDTTKLVQEMCEVVFADSERGQHVLLNL